MSTVTPLYTFVLRLADDHLILGQRVSELCGHAPMLEEDMALPNIGLDLLGQARALYTYAAELQGLGKSEDDLAFCRQERDYLNALLVERPNLDFAHTIVRHLLHALFAQQLWQCLQGSSDATLAAIAGKASKETAYHVRHTSEWLIRLGDGTDESHERAQEALDILMPYAKELFEDDATTQAMSDAGVAPLPSSLFEAWSQRLDEILAMATLSRPEASLGLSGGRDGRHTEEMGHVLAELQYMQRAYPGLTW